MNLSKYRIVAAASLLLVLTACNRSAEAPAPEAPGGQAVVEAPAGAGEAVAPAAAADQLQPRYAATLSEGIDFKRPGYPEFVTEVAGVSGAEDWGRWTDASLAPAARIRFNQPLPQNFTLNLKVRDFFGVNADKEVVVTAGDQKQTFVLAKDGDQDVQLAFAGVNGDAIEIAAPASSEPTATDSRKMGIGLITLSVKN